MVILTFVLAIVNIVIGFWLAMRLGFGPPTLTDAWDALICFEATGVEDAELFAATDLTDHLDALLEDDHEDDDFDLECIVVEEQEVEKEVELDYEVSDMLDPTNPEYWDLSEKFVETSILKLVIAAIKTGVRMTTVDTLLRNGQSNPDHDLIQSSQSSLAEDCQVYLDEQKAAAEDLEKRLDTLENQEVALDLTSDLEIQTQKLEQTMKRIQETDLDADPKESVDYLIDKLNQLRATRHLLIDVHNQLFLAIARNEKHLGSIDTHMLEDHLTKLHNRIGMESTLGQWFSKRRHQSRQLNMAIFDVYEFTAINNKLGILLGDKILVELAKQLRESCGADDLIGRFNGQQFMVIYSDIGPQAAIKKAETFRQMVKESSFLVNDELCPLELNFAFTEIKPDDKNEEIVIKRLLEALEESKEEGPNQSFSHDGTYTRRIDSPSLKIQPQTINL